MVLSLLAVPPYSPAFPSYDHSVYFNMDVSLEGLNGAIKKNEEILADINKKYQGAMKLYERQLADLNEEYVGAIKHYEEEFADVNQILLRMKLNLRSIQAINAAAQTFR